MTAISSTPPSATGCPFAGKPEDFSLFSDEYIADPYPALNHFREETPVFFNKETGYWIVTRFEDVQRCLKAGVGFSTANVIDPLVPPCPAALQKLGEAGVVITGTLINEEGEAHALHRKPMQAALSPGYLRGLESFVRAETTKAMDKIIRLGQADLMADFSFWIPANVIFHMMRVPAEDIPTIKNWVVGEAKLIWGFPTPEEQVDLAANLGEFWKYTAAQLERLKTDLRDDFVSELVRQHLADPENWSADYITWLTLNFMFAGHETAAAGAGNAIRLLMENRDQWDLLVADPALIPNAVEETLRHTGSVLAWRRKTTEEIELSGVRIPAGANLKIMFGAANRDGRMFQAPDTFDIRRSNANRHLTFGFGPHSCLGAPLGRIEIKVILEEMVKRMPHVRLSPNQKFSYPYTTTHRGPERLLAQWDVSANPVLADRP